MAQLCRGTSRRDTCGTAEVARNLPHVARTRKSSARPRGGRSQLKRDRSRARIEPKDRGGLSRPPAGKAGCKKRRGSGAPSAQRTAARVTALFGHHATPTKVNPTRDKFR